MQGSDMPPPSPAAPPPVPPSSSSRSASTEPSRALPKKPQAPEAAALAQTPDARPPEPPRVPSRLFLKNNLAVLEERVASGGFGEVWSARVLNPFALVAERVVRGEEDPKWLGLEDLPAPPPAMATTPGAEPEPEFAPLTDPGVVRRVYDAADHLWKEYLDLRQKDSDRAREANRNLLELIDPALLQSSRIAVKVFRPAMLREMLANDPAGADQIREESERRFIKENDLLRRLQHPGIVRRFGLVNDSEIGWCLLLEFIEGDNLDEVLKKLPGHRLPLAVAAAKALEIADALDFAHRQGIIHRDLKPSNIMLSAKDSRAVLTDFGIGRWTDESRTQQLTIPGAMVGTPRYMAPEQILGERVTERTDMYQLGTLLFEMVGGQAAYAGFDQTSLFAMISKPNLSHPVYLRDLLPEISNDFETLIEVARDKDPGNRWDFDEFIDRLRALLQSGRLVQQRAERAVTHTDLKRSYRRATRLRKVLSWRERRLGSQIHIVRLQEEIQRTRQMLEDRKFDDALVAVEALAKEAESLSDRSESLKTEIARLLREVQLAVSQHRAFRMLALATQHLGQANYPAVGAALNAVEQHLHTLPLDGYTEVRNVYRRLLEKFEPCRPFVQVFNTVQTSFIHDVAAGIRELIQLAEAKQPVSVDRLRLLSEKIAAAQIMLRSIEPAKIGPVYERTVKTLQEQRATIEMLQQTLPLTS
jgi:serine/threonine protein kinase/cell division protein FtsB